VRLELDQVHAAIGGRVLVLLADRLAQPLDLEHTGLLRELLLGCEHALMGVERVEQRDRERARGAEPGARRNVGDRHHSMPGSIFIIRSASRSSGRWTSSMRSTGSVRAYLRWYFAPLK
jgi:hypothetical protein